jgi:hypothetical protein
MYSILKGKRTNAHSCGSLIKSKRCQAITRIKLRDASKRTKSTDSCSFKVCVIKFVDIYRGN